jgi:hypothetical protein
VSSNEIPRPILEKHPEIHEVEEALKAHRDGKPVTVRCRYCNTPISVTEIAATGALVVACEKGCTYFRAVRG